MWNNYKDIFPLRYIEHGYFDDYILGVIKKIQPKTILDIGGGVNGTQVLKDVDAKVYLLDPFVDDLPNWINGRVEWGTLDKFDLIVARGSINYLTENELKSISSMLNLNAVFVANTFLEPPSEEWSQRPYVDSFGRKGIEKSRYDSKRKVVEHELIPDGGETIRHKFFYRSEQDYKEIFSDIEFVPYKGNSVIIKFTKQY